MKKLRQFQIDAFASRVFEGNPAAVVPLDRWLTDASLQAIAAENNLSETAFFVADGAQYHLRWFAPLGEINMCGHATLASAYVLFELLGYRGDTIAFNTRSGRLIVERQGERLAMNFPALLAQACPAPTALLAGLKHQPIEVFATDDYFAVYQHEDDIRGLAPDLAELSKLDRRGVCITARGKSVDFVSRFFGPKWGIPEDPVTGSAHCTLAPYWAERLGKSRLVARQLSRRGGEVHCELRGERVIVSGSAVKFLEGEIVVPD